MSNSALSADESQQAALHGLLRAIVSQNRATASQLLLRAPVLARFAIEVGATREASQGYFFEEISTIRVLLEHAGHRR